MTVNNFAEKLGFKNGMSYGFRGHLHYFEREGTVEVKQAGYSGDSLHHPKVVVIKKWDLVERRFNLPSGLLQKKSLPRYKRIVRHKHKDFSIVAIVNELQVHNKNIRTVILKCGLCEFHIRGFQVNGKMQQAHTL